MAQPKRLNPPTSMVRAGCALGARRALLAALIASIPWPALAAENTVKSKDVQVSADGVWSGVADEVATGRSEPADFVILKKRTVALDRTALAPLLATAPLERTAEADRAPGVIFLPMPDGGFARFAFVESPIMAPELAAQYPELRTYLGWGLDDPHASVRFDDTPLGFHAQVLSPSGAVYIDPAPGGADGWYESYLKRDYRRVADDFRCHVESDGLSDEPTVRGVRAGGQLRTYRLAVAATREYTSYHGGTVSAGLSAITTAINRVNGIYETELGIRFTLVANNNLLVYTSEPDPYTNGSSSSMITENQANIDAVIGTANYDIGHVFGTSGGGLAMLSSVCVSGQKAQGATGRNPPTGDAFWVDYVAHEFGHQFGAQHTFNSELGSCGSAGQRIEASAYEPGSGSTIMAYAGICDADDLQTHSDPYFHHESFRQISDFINFGSGSSCAALSATGNNDPTVEAGPNRFIPRLTPFEVTAAGNDVDGDPLTYSWEQRDTGPAVTVSTPDNGSSPLFRAWPPSTSPLRTMTRLAELLNNTTPFGEQLPNTLRILHFRVTARDNRAGGGGVGYDDMQITVDTSAGPFVVTSPNTGAEVWSESGVVNWDVAGSNTGAVQAATVDIMLSTNGGQTFPITLAAGTPNDGSEAVSFSVKATTQARVKVAGTGKIFFDICDANFTINPPALLIDLPAGAPNIVAPGVPTPFAVEITPYGQNLLPGSAQLFYRFDGGSFASAALSPLGGDLYEAVLPRTVCTDTPEFYISAQGDLGTVVHHPLDAPSNAFITTVGLINVLFADDFESDLGWTVTNAALDGFWQRGVPVNQDRGDPPADFDSSGQCYVTENATDYPNNDVDSGSTHLMSPAIDLSNGGTISYAVWLNDYFENTMGPEDGLDVSYATDAPGTNWQLIRAYTGGQAVWRTDSIDVGAETPTSATFRIRFTAKDIPPGDIVEAGVDAISVTQFVCPEVGDGDFDLDNDVDLMDFAAAQDCWPQVGISPACEPGDLNGDDVLDATDLDIFTTILTGP